MLTVGLCPHVITATETLYEVDDVRGRGRPQVNAYLPGVDESKSNRRAGVGSRPPGSLRSAAWDSTASLWWFVRVSQ